MIEKSYEQKETESIVYEEIEVGSFEEASDRIIEENLLYTNKIFSILSMDLDGVIVGGTFDDKKISALLLKPFLDGDDLIKLPFLSHIVDPEIEEGKKNIFKKLAEFFEGRMLIATNRDSRVKLFWTSDKVMEKVDSLQESVNEDFPVYERMQKQVPFLARKRVDKMVEYWGKLLIEHNEDNTVERIVLQSVEDKSIVVPNRSTFLKYVAGKLYERYGRKVLIKNYVIQ
jgi:hypothetical protein